MEPGSFYIAVGALSLGAIWLGRKLGGVRDEQFRAWAEANGFRFHEEIPAELPSPGLKGMGLFRRGGNPSYHRVLSRENGPRGEYLFDFSYVVSNGKSSSTVWHTVAAYRIRGWNIPAFELKPENLAHKIGSLMGYQDIDFAESPKFSANYLLRGEDEDAIRETMGTAFLDYLGANPDWQIDARGDWMFLYKRNEWRFTRLGTKEFGPFWAEAARALEYFLEGRPQESGS